MNMSERMKALPPLPPPEAPDAEALAIALEARNALLADALANFHEAWVHVRGTPVPEIEDVIRICRVRRAA